MAFVNDFWQTSQAPLSPPVLIPEADPASADDAPPTLPSSVVATSALHFDFSGAFTLLSPAGAGACSQGSQASGKRGFSLAFGGEAPDVARRKRASALHAVPAREPTPSTSEVAAPSAPSVPDDVLRSALLTLCDPATRAPGWIARLESRALDVLLDKGPYADAHRLLEGLLRRLEAEPSMTHWVTAFERVIALMLRFESRTQSVARSMLLTCDRASGDVAQALARASTKSSIEHLIGHRLHAIADMPADRRATAWHELLASLRRLRICTSTERLASLARFIGLLATDEQVPAATALIDASCESAAHEGWRELTSALLGTVPSRDMARMARAMTHAGRRLYGADMKDIVESLSGCVDRMPAHDARALVGHLVDIVMMRGDFDHLVFGPDECAQMLDDLRSTCRRLGFDDLARTLEDTLAEVCDEYKATMMD
ncbi:hypothetical protein UC34_06620 [Pandoraea vervacti]|uniref:TyeA family type III secretion system gatekeeper subunit n=1 Tax=Pandoraea vervacti TaxID=656178 RepID=A0ABM5SW73_9BURK|nr:hypothetical protein [Pandoraea vervacti]AJP56746.1 hypothetical protein UC34_06620 [Pandoraea vervacti]